MKLARRIWQIPRAGSIGNLRLIQDELSEPGPGEARVAVRAVGLNFADLFALQGLYSATPAGAFVPGLEFSGVIEALGPARAGETDRASTTLQTGDRVMGAIRFGAYADRLNADLRYLRRIPAGWDFAEGAALPAQGLTAYYALRELGNLRANQTVLVHSVAGGVGLLALEIARRMGAEVIGTIGSPAKIDFLVNECGVPRDQIIVRDPRRFGAQLDAALAALRKRKLMSEGAAQTENGPLYDSRPDHGFDQILDAVAGEYFQPAFTRLQPAGRMILFGVATMMTGRGRPNYLKLAWRYLTRPRLDPIQMISDNRNCMAFNLIWLWDRIDELGRLYDELIALDLPAPHVGRRFAFEDAHAALKYFQSGQSVGKVVLEPQSTTQSGSGVDI